MKKLLSLLGSVSMVGTAGATVVACGNEKASETVPKVSKQDLVTLIHQARELSTKNKGINPDAEAELELLIAAAQKVVDDVDADQDQVNESIGTLTRGIKNFQDAIKTNYSELEALVQEATNLKNNPKNPIKEDDQEILDNLVVAIENAQKVINENNSSQPEVNKLLLKLKEAMQAFSQATATNFSVLKETISQAEEAIKKPVNSNSDEKALRASIDAAKGVLKNTEATQTEVDKAAGDLWTEINKFENAKETDYSKLDNAIKKAEITIKDNVNPNANEEIVLKSAIELSKIILNSEKASQDQVDKALTSLELAIKNFKEKTDTDFSQLKNKIADAQKAFEDNKNSDTNAETIFTTAIDDAKLVVNNAKATQKEVEVATSNLSAAIDAFKEATKTDYSGLLILIEEAISLKNNNDNPNKDVAKFELAIAEAQKVAQNPQASQNDVNNAAKVLIQSIEDFKSVKETDNSQLIAKIAEANKAILDNKNKEKGQKETLTLKEVVNSAQEIVNKKKEATQKEVEDATSNLSAAIDAFKNATKTDFDSLNLTILVADGIAKNSSNPNVNKEMINSAIQSATTVSRNEQATQKEVDAAESDLLKVINNVYNTPKTNTARLSKKIEEAEEAISLTKHPDAEKAKAALKKAINEASKFIGKEATTPQTVIEDAVSTLEEAIQIFKEATKGEALSNVLKTPKKLWLNSESFQSFANEKMSNTDLAKLVWTGMLDARHSGEDTPEADANRKESEKEFREKHLEKIIRFQINVSDIDLEDAQTFARDILNAGKELQNKTTDINDNLKKAINKLETSIENATNTKELLKVTSDTAASISEFKAHLNLENKAEVQSFNLVVKKNEKIRLSLNEELVAYFTSGENIKPTLINKGDETFPNLTFVLQI